MINPFADCDPGWHFAHVIGPDGADVLIVDVRTHRGAGHTVSIPDDGRTSSPEERLDGWWIHKWRVVRVQPVVFPAANVSGSS
jgi:hypothetical protein